MKLLNPNTPLSNFIYTIINEKNKQIKENILLGEVTFPKILFYSKEFEDNSFRTNSHISFINNLNRQKQLSEVREEKSNLEKKVNMVDNQLLFFKNNNLSSNNNILNYNERYLNTNLNNNNNIKKNSDNKSNSNTSKKKSNHRNKSDHSLSSDKKNKNENVKSLPTLGKDKNMEKRIQNISLKPIQIKSYKSNSKVNNHETEEKLEKNAKAFIHKINSNKKNILAMINKRQEKYNLKLKNEIEKMEMQKNLKLDEYNQKNNNNNLYGNGNIYNNNMDYNNYNNYSNLDSIRKEDYKYSSDNSRIIRNNNKTNIINKKYYHYSPYSYRNPKMLKNLSKDLLNFNSELYYNNNVPDIIQYQSILVPMYRNNNIIYRDGSSPMIVIEDMDTIRNNNQDIIDATNGEINSNLSRINNYSKIKDETIIENNNIDYSFNKKHLYYFNEPKYGIELTNGEIENDKSKVKIKNNNL